MYKTISLLITSLCIFTLSGCSLFSDETKELDDVEKTKVSKNVEEVEASRVVEEAKELYTQKKESGMNFSDGPCLGIIENEWVVDIAHSPRLPIDNRPENQCEAFRSGKAKHFVELDPEGNLIRVK